MILLLTGHGGRIYMPFGANFPITIPLVSKIQCLVKIILALLLPCLNQKNPATWRAWKTTTANRLPVMTNRSNLSMKIQMVKKLMNSIVTVRYVDI